VEKHTEIVRQNYLLLKVGSCFNTYTSKSIHLYYGLIVFMRNTTLSVDPSSKSMPFMGDPHACPYLLKQYPRMRHDHCDYKAYHSVVVKSVICFCADAGQDPE
jgi:hypothetical protein